MPLSTFPRPDCWGEESKNINVNLFRKLTGRERKGKNRGTPNATFCLEGLSELTQKERGVLLKENYTKKMFGALR